MKDEILHHIRYSLGKDAEHSSDQPPVDGANYRMLDWGSAERTVFGHDA